jgi:hypothetical protein
MLKVQKNDNYVVHGSVDGLVLGVCQASIFDRDFVQNGFVLLPDLRPIRLVQPRAGHVHAARHVHRRVLLV